LRSFQLSGVHVAHPTMEEEAALREALKNLSVDTSALVGLLQRSAANPYAVQGSGPAPLTRC